MRRETEIYNKYMSIRANIVRSVESMHPYEDAEDIVEKAFQYVVEMLLNGNAEVGVGDIRNLVWCKARLLVLDASRGRNRRRTRSGSVVAADSIDRASKYEEGDRRNVDLTVKASYELYVNRLADDKARRAARDRFQVKLALLKEIKDNSCATKQSIIERCMLGGMNRDELAQELGTTRSNIDVSIWKTLRNVNRRFEQLVSDGKIAIAG